MYAQSFNGSGGSWTTSGGTWAWDRPAGLRKQTSTAAGESASVVNPAVMWGEITATARVRLDAGTNALAGLVLRRHTSNAPAYFVGLRNSESAWYCGIYEKSGRTLRCAQGRLWTNRTPGLTNCKYATGGWHTLMVRAAGGRIEMHVDGALIATWVDADATLPLPAQGFGLMTFDGAASFDDIKVYGLATRSYYMFGAGRVGERTTTHGQAAGSSTGAGGGTRYALHTDHLGSVSLATDAWGVTVTLSLARYYPFGAERGAAPSALPTDFGYATGRATDFGLIQIGARWYIGHLARWTSPDTLVPNQVNPQSIGRYSYNVNNPVKYIDPTGHEYTCSPGVGCTGDVPDLTATCDTHGCQLDGALNDLIAFYAQEFGIPYELLYVTLLTEALDDVSLEKANVDSLYGSVAERMNSPYIVSAIAGALEYAALTSMQDLRNLIEARSAGIDADVSDMPGGGINNIHVKPVNDARDWIRDYYGASAVWTLLKQHGASDSGRVFTRDDQVLRDLASTDGNVMYAAAILRRLVDIRTQTTGQNYYGSNALTVDVQAIIYGAYRAGMDSYGGPRAFVDRVKPGDSYGSRYVAYYTYWTGHP